VIVSFFRCGLAQAYVKAARSSQRGQQRMLFRYTREFSVMLACTDVVEISRISLAIAAASARSCIGAHALKVTSQ